MEPTIIAALISSSVPTVIAAVGWFITYRRSKREDRIHREEVERGKERHRQELEKLNLDLARARHEAAQRERETSDRGALELWRIAFDRPAFKGPYQWHSDQDAFRQAINLTIKCINTGSLYDRHENTVSFNARARTQIENPEWRKAGEAMVSKLADLTRLIPRDKQRPDQKTQEDIDQIRNEVIDILNPIWESVGLRTARRPTEAKDLEEVFPKE
jgi:hypothetical protein